jgi:hypothetical protein
LLYYILTFLDQIHEANPFACLSRVHASWLFWVS